MTEHPGSFEKSAQPHPYARDQDGNVEYDDSLDVACPTHTTERRLITKIDWHVVPFISVMYLLAFLDR